MDLIFVIILKKNFFKDVIIFCSQIIYCFWSVSLGLVLFLLLIFLNSDLKSLPIFFSLVRYTCCHSLNWNFFFLSYAKLVEPSKRSFYLFSYTPFISRPTILNSIVSQKAIFLHYFNNNKNLVISIKWVSEYIMLFLINHLSIAQDKWQENIKKEKKIVFKIERVTTK